jgi:hypothetical protein
MQKIAASTVVGVGAVECEPAAGGTYEPCVVKERNPSVKTIIICGDKSAIRVDDPRHLGTGVLAHSRVPGTAHGTEAGKVVGEREAGDDPS